MECDKSWDIDLCPQHNVQEVYVVGMHNKKTKESVCVCVCVCVLSSNVSFC